MKDQEVVRTGTKWVFGVLRAQFTIFWMYLLASGTIRPWETSLLIMSSSINWSQRMIGSKRLIMAMVVWVLLSGLGGQLTNSNNLFKSTSRKKAWCHEQLCNDLTEHTWPLHGGRYLIWHIWALCWWSLIFFSSYLLLYDAWIWIWKLWICNVLNYGL
jgi:hypothetical protein